MTLFEKHPSLFGIFHFKVRTTLQSFPIGEVECQVHGFCHGEFYCQYSGITEWIPVKKCILIARPISSITHEEVRKIYPHWEGNERVGKKHVIEAVNIGQIKMDGLLVLRSWGIYPGPEEDFETDRLERAEV